MVKGVTAQVSPVPELFPFLLGYTSNLFSCLMSRLQEAYEKKVGAPGTFDQNIQIWIHPVQNMAHS